MHAHPRTRSADRIIPENVESQIWLWEREESRITPTLTLQVFFENDEKSVFNEVCEEAGSGVVYKNESEGYIFVRYSDAERVVAVKRKKVEESREEDGGDMIVY